MSKKNFSLYGLPEHVVFCKSCVISNQRPSSVIEFKNAGNPKKGIEIDGVQYKSILAKLENQQKSNAWISMALKEGKNREIRKIMTHFGYSVNRLIRISYGPFNLNSLKPGSLIEIVAPDKPFPT